MVDAQMKVFPIVNQTAGEFLRRYAVLAEIFSGNKRQEFNVFGALVRALL